MADAWGLSTAPLQLGNLGRAGVAGAMAGPNASSSAAGVSGGGHASPGHASDYVHMQSPMGVGGGGTGGGSSTGRAKVAPVTGDQVELLKTDNVVAEGALTLADLGVTTLETPEAIVPTYLWRFRDYGEFHKASEA